MRATHPFTFSHVVFNASRLYRSSSSIVCSIFSLSFKTVPNIFFRLASEQISSRQGVRYAGEANLMYTRIDHVHHLWAHLFLHTPLLLFEFARPVLQLANVNLAKIILRSCLAKQTVRVHPTSTETKLMVGSRTHWLSSAIHSYCLSRFVVAVT